METFGFFEAIAHQNTRKPQSTAAQPAQSPEAQQPLSQPNHQTQPQPKTQASPSPKSQSESMVDPDPVFACWGML